MIRFLFSIIIIAGFSTLYSQQISIQSLTAVPSNAQINDILIYSDEVFVASNKGLFKFNQNTLDSEILFNEACNILSVNKKGDLWAAVDQRYLLNLSTNEKLYFNVQDLKVSNAQADDRDSSLLQSSGLRK